MNTSTLPMKKILLAACALAALLFAVTTGATSNENPAHARGLNFSHTLHEGQGMTCEACHATATGSRSGSDDLLPGHPQCQDCHDVNDDNGCTMCHRGDPSLSPRISKYSAKFDHERHTGAGKTACATCHADLDSPLPKTAVGHLPAMAECMECHNNSRVENQCSACHLPKENLTPADHTLNWTNGHGLSASADQDRCNVCHKADDCMVCHNGDAIFSPHPNNYVSRHGQDAHLSDLSCSTCHDTRDDCNACHAQFGVMPHDHSDMDWTTQSGGQHAESAEFDLESCMACHDAPRETPVCARCHHQ